MNIEVEWAKDCMHWRGRVLTGDKAHYCLDWDGLPVDETCLEWSTCQCMPHDQEPAP